MRIQLTITPEFVWKVRFLCIPALGATACMPLHCLHQLWSRILSRSPTCALADCINSEERNGSVVKMHACLAQFVAAGPVARWLPALVGVGRGPSAQQAAPCRSMDTHKEGTQPLLWQLAGRCLCWCSKCMQTHSVEFSLLGAAIWVHGYARAIVQELKHVGCVFEEQVVGMC